MPLAKIKVGDYSDVDAAEGFSNYAGPVPPKGLYLCSIKFVKLIENNSGDPMFKLLFEISEPKGTEKAKFNGYAIWHNANITKTGAPYLNAMLDALAIPRKAVYASKIVMSAEKEDRVVKIGPVTVDGLRVLITTARKEWPKDSDNWSLEAKAFAEAEQTGGAQVTEYEPEETENLEEDYTEPDETEAGDGDEDAF